MGKPPQLKRAIQMAHSLIRERVQPGDSVIDATAGNGHDSLFLAQTVGGNGLVSCFDIQEAAIRNTRERTNGMQQVALHHTGHENIPEIIHSPVKAATFNLGYLPAGDKQITTGGETTVAALNSVIALLEAGGIITVVLYPGHPEGEREAKQVEAWATELDQSIFTVILYQTINQRNSPPYLIAVERRSNFD
ncbi:MAG: class I SAM-dependent methyltransferase [Verrucomicrobiales bacterium]|nr:class I SAM-dependent methyltransferase [Verrucomicrobiales bacterium]